MQTSEAIPPHGRPGAPRAFASGGYEILDGRFEDRGEIMLWSTAGRAPRCGELFTIERREGLFDLSVIEVAAHNPGWSALCRRVAAGL